AVPQRRHHGAVQVDPRTPLRAACGRCIRLAMDTPAKTPVHDFNSVETWVFDLDNTLYPHDTNLWQQIDDRIRAFVSEFLRLTQEDAFRVQKDYYKRYGTTM